MSKKLSNIRRILRVQEQLQELAQVKVATIQRQQSDLESSEHRLMFLLSGGDPVINGMLLHSAALRLREISSRKARLNDARQKAEEEMAKRNVVKRMTERFLEVSQASHAQEEEKREHIRIVDQLAARVDASFP